MNYEGKFVAVVVNEIIVMAVLEQSGVYLQAFLFSALD